MNSNMEKPYVVGIDIGGTNTVFGIVDARGTIIASSSIKTAESAGIAAGEEEACHVQRRQLLHGLENVRPPGLVVALPDAAVAVRTHIGRTGEEQGTRVSVH